MNLAELQTAMKELQDKLETETLSADEKQIIVDQISSIKRDIEYFTKSDKQIMPIIGAPTIAEKKIHKSSMFTNASNIRI
jgi:hypothetical protein